MRRNDRRQVYRQSVSFGSSGWSRLRHGHSKDIPVITIGVYEFGTSRNPMSTIFRGWIDFPPVLQDGGVRQALRPPSKPRPHDRQAFGVLQVVDTETSPATRPGVRRCACPPARPPGWQLTRSKLPPGPPSNELATGVPVLPDGQEHLRHGHDGQPLQVDHMTTPTEHLTTGVPPTA